MSSRVWIVLCGCTVLAGIGGPAQGQQSQGQQSQGQQSQGQPSTPRKEPAFDIREFRVNGNSVLSTREIERVITPFLGEKRHFSDVEGARKALEDAYEKAGYQTVFVDIPEQRVNAGVVYLHVLEGKVGQVHVTGSRYFDEDQIRATVPQLSSGNVPDFSRMQQEMAELNKSSDRQVAPVLTPGRTPGTVDVNLSVKDALPLHGDIEDDNHASPFTKPDRLNASLHYDNLWQQQHSLAVNYQLAPQKPSETNVLYATYLWRFAQSDDVLSIYGIRSNSNIAVVGSSTILGNSKILGARYIVPIGSGETDDARYFHSFTFGIDRKDFAQTNISAQFSDITVLPQIDYVPLSLTYSSVLVRNSRTEQFSLGVVTAPRSLFGNTDAKFESRRVFGTASYYVWKWDASLEQTISRRWTFYTRFTGQWTFDPLIPNEQFVTGGADSVRGYRESEISGDRGANGTLEARWYPRGHSVDPTAASLYLCAFTDGAQVRLVHPSGPQISLISIASTGVGVHAQGWHGVHLALDVAKDLRDGGRGVTGPITPEGSVRVEASLGYTF